MSATQPLPEVLQGRLEGDVETITAPNSPRRPWVVASGEFALKAYNLSQFDAVDRSRLLGEAETALVLADIDGVVDTHGFEVVDGWLLIAMERLGESVADHLRAVAAGARDALGPARWGVLIEAVALALGEVHRRHRLHRDVKPDNLIFDRAGERLMVADFSVAARQRRRGDGKASLAGTRRYIAPEVMRGRVGPAADQYGLGVTAGEVLGGEAPPSAKAVLLRATEQSPEDRYPSIVDFGLALRSALDDTAPRRISARLQRVSARWRQTWGVAVAAFAAMYAWLLWSRPSSLGWEDGLLRPLVVMALVALMARMLNRLRGGRTQPRLPLADRGWFPVLLFALAMGALSPLLVDNPSKTGKWAFFAALGALALSAALGSVRRDAGERLIALVRRWESRREGHRRDFVLWWGGRLLALVVVALLAALPPAFARRWPGGDPTAPAAGTPAITVVAMMRSTMLSERWGRSCALARVPSQPRKAGCARWAPLAGDWLRADVRAGAPRLAADDLKDVVLTSIPDAERFGGPMWRIRDRGGDRPDLGWLAEEDDTGRVWEVAISRRPPVDDPTQNVEAQWKYEVIRGDGRWRVTAIEACDFSAASACVRITQLDRDELATVARRGPPGGP